MQIYRRALLPVALLLLLFSAHQVAAQQASETTRLATTKLETTRLAAEFSNGFTQLIAEPGSVLQSEQRFINRERLTEASARRLTATGAAVENMPPTFEISPDVRTLRVGEHKLFNFAFGDPEGDPYFAGVIAVNTRIDTEAGRLKPKEQLRAAPVLINVLASPDPSVVMWDISGQNPGITIFFISIAEIFADQTNGQFKLTSGQIKYVAYAFRVIGENEDEAGAPTFINRMNDLTFREGERTQLLFGARSPENRPLTYNYLYLAYASRLVSGRFRGSYAELKAIEPGKGVFVAYTTDGNQADLQTFIVTVKDGTEAIPPEPQLRALSAGAVVGRGLPIPLDLYGENFTSNSQVMLSTADGETPLTSEFISSTDLKVQLPATLTDTVSLRVVDNNITTTALPFQILTPVILEVRRIRDTKGKVTGFRLFSYGVGRAGEISANGVVLPLIREQSAFSKIGEQIVVKLPAQLRGEASVQLRAKNSGGLISEPVALSLAAK